MCFLHWKDKFVVPVLTRAPSKVVVPLSFKLDNSFIVVVAITPLTFDVMVLPVLVEKEIEFVVEPEITPAATQIGVPVGLIVNT